MKWQKEKRIDIPVNRAQVPVVDDSYSDKFRIYYSSRDDRNRSMPFYVDVCRKDPSRVLFQCKTPVLQRGKVGSFDWAGVMPTEIIEVEGRKYLYYIGWSQRVDVPYHNSIGLAVSEDGENFKKVSEGPIFTTSRLEPGYVGTISVVHEDSHFNGYYLSCRDWVRSGDRYEPIYDIKLATSKDGIDWTPTGITCLSLEENEGGISQACVRRLKSGLLEMHFSSRGKVDYRENKSVSYRIRRAISEDGVHWKRCPGISLDISGEGWDSEMTAYPYLVSDKNFDFIFYNGNGFGQSGMGYAKRVRQIKFE